MKPILCATDYSDNSAQALKMAYALSKKLSAQLIILHIFDINTTLISPLTITYTKMEKAAFEKHREKLMLFCDTHIGQLPDEIHTKAIVKKNAMVQEGILEVVTSFDASMVVMGMKGTSALKNMILGSTTKIMLDKSPCPLLAVPASIKNYDLARITYATDFEVADIYAIEWLASNLATPYNSTLNIVHIATKNDYAGQDQMEWFKEMLIQKVVYKNLNFNLHFSNSIFETLVQQLKETQSNMVAMLERENSSFMESLTHVDLVKKMVSKGNIPLLSFCKHHITAKP